MRQMNKRKSNLISYVQGIHADMEIPKTVWQNEIYLSFWTKKTGVGVLDFKGKDCNSQEDEKE